METAKTPDPFERPFSGQQAVISDFEFPATSPVAKEIDESTALSRAIRNAISSSDARRLPDGYFQPFTIAIQNSGIFFKPVHPVNPKNAGWDFLEHGQDAVDQDLFLAIAHATVSMTISFTATAHVTRGGKYFVANAIKFQGHISDLYDFNYSQGGTIASAVQAGFMATGQAGHVFSDGFDFGGTLTGAAGRLTFKV